MAGLSTTGSAMLPPVAAVVAVSAGASAKAAVARPVGSTLPKG